MTEAQTGLFDELDEAQPDFTDEDFNNLLSSLFGPGGFGAEPDDEVAARYEALAVEVNDVLDELEAHIANGSGQDVTVTLNPTDQFRVINALGMYANNTGMVQGASSEALDAAEKILHAVGH